MRIRPHVVFLLVLSSCTSQVTGIETSTTPTTVNAGVTSPPGVSASVTRIFDGDSLIAEIENGDEVEVRMLGINAPEGSECHGDSAKRTLEQLLETGPIVLVADAEDTDQFDRLLRYIYVDGLNINLAMLANGDAVALQGDHALNVDFVTIGDAAFSSQLGMWAPDACGARDTLPPIAIVDYIYNPDGRDADDLNGEWIAVANNGSSGVEMSGWVLRDESTRNRYQFPVDFALQPGAEVLVHSGCGADSQSDLYWCANDPIWSNGGDTVMLQLPSGTVVARDRYDGDF